MNLGLDLRFWWIPFSCSTNVGVDEDGSVQEKRTNLDLFLIDLDPVKLHLIDPKCWIHISSI